MRFIKLSSGAESPNYVDGWSYNLVFAAFRPFAATRERRLAIDRRNFLTALAATPFAAPLAVPFANAAIPGPGPAQPMHARYALTRDRVLHGAGPAYTPEFLMEDIHGSGERRFTNYSGDVSGRWIGALASASAVYGEDFPALAPVVRRVVAAQHPEGFFGKTFHFDAPVDDDMALLWGNGRLLVGLVEFYRLSHDGDTLAAARRLGDFFMRLAPMFNSQEMADRFSASHFASSYICWLQLTEGLAGLYVETKDARYRELCEAISMRAERRPADHVHGYLCSLRGSLDLFDATHDAATLARVQAAWQDIAGSGDVLITGGVPEAWSPKKLRTEGCAECDWLRLNLGLWRATGDERYIALAEKILFNEFAMNQFATGDFGHAVLNELGTPGVVQVRAWWCCTLHGMRAFAEVHRSAFRGGESASSFDLPIDAAIDTPTFAARSSSSLATDGTVSLAIVKASPDHTLTVRKPVWAKSVGLTLNGRAVPGLSVAHLKGGDTVKATYAMALIPHQAGAAKPLATRTAFAFGPWLLGASSAADPGYFNELHPNNTITSTEGRHTAEDVHSPFAVPVAATELGYLPAEFPEQAGSVELRAVAEQTAYPPARWEMAFKVLPDGRPARAAVTL